MKKIILPVLSVCILSACATSSGPQALKTDDTRACAQNFTYSGSFLAGRKYKTNVSVKNVSKNTAMERATRHILNDGWTITSTDKKLGFISASQTVSHGNGKTVPLNIGIESKKRDVNVSITYATSGGVLSPLEAIVSHFCSTIEAIEG